MENRIIENKDLPSFNDRFMNTALVKNLETERVMASYFDFTLEEEKDSDGVSVLGLRPYVKHIETSTIETSSIINKEIEDSINQIHGIDVHDLTANAIINEDFAGKSRKLAQIYFKLGEESGKDLYNKKMSKNWITKIINKYRKTSIPVYVEKLEDLTKYIILYSNVLGANSRRGKADFILTNGRIGAELQDSPMFIFNSDNGVIEAASPHLIGQICGMDVFVDPFMKFNDNRVLFGRKSKEHEPCIIYGEYKNSLYRIDVASFPPSEKIALSSRFLLAEVGDSIKNNYICMNVEFNKKPLWQKLLKI